MNIERYTQNAQNAVVECQNIGVSEGHQVLDGEHLHLALLMQKEGLMCLEAYHMAHTQAECQAFDRMARRLGLLVTGGSDYHGLVKQIELGDGMQYWTTREQDLEAFLQKVQ